MTEKWTRDAIKYQFFYRPPHSFSFNCIRNLVQSKADSNLLFVGNQPLFVATLSLTFLVIFRDDCTQ